jgi:hypothetical protein
LQDNRQPGAQIGAQSIHPVRSIGTPRPAPEKLFNHDHRVESRVLRFVQMFAVGQGSFPSAGASGSHSFNQLLSLLTEQGKAAGFGRFYELRTAIEEARSAEQLRDAIFSDAHSNDHAALRRAAAELERLDATFVGLCVEHVLEQHARAALVLSSDD